MGGACSLAALALPLGLQGRGIGQAVGHEEWLLYILRGVEDTTRWTTAKIAAIRALADHAAALAPGVCSPQTRTARRFPGI